METTRAPDPTVQRLVEELVRCGLFFTDALATLTEVVEETGACPGEHPAEAAVAMAAGSVQKELRGQPHDELERAIDLIVTARDRVVADLKLAAELSKRRARMRPSKLDDA